MLLNSRLISTLSVLSYADRMVKGLYWFAGLTQLLFILVCSVIGDYLPVIGRYLGRMVGKIYRAINSQQCQQIVSVIDYHTAAFVTAQLGTNYPTITNRLAPAICVVNESTIETPDYQLMTRRELLTIAKQLRLIGYSRMDTEQLREAILSGN